MRILLVSDYGTPTGGAELVMLALREGLRARGHDARLFASSARPLQARSLADYECLGYNSAARGLIQVINPSAYLRLRRVLASFRPDVVHVRLFLSQLSPAVLPLLRDVPALFHAAWYRSVCPIGTKMLPSGESCTERAGLPCLAHRCFPALAWPSAMLQMQLWRHWRDVFRLVVANSRATARRLEEDGIGPVEVVWNGVPATPARAATGGPPRIAFAGRLVREKGADLLIRAFATVRIRYPEARLLIAGDGPERSRLAHLVEELSLGSCVELTGHLPRERMEERLADATLQVVPSRWEEPFGLVAAESLMRGTPLIATHGGGLGELVQHERTGLLVPPNEETALAAAMLRLLDAPALAAQLAAQGREFALRHLTEDAFVDRFLVLYEAMMA